MSRHPRRVLPGRIGHLLARFCNFQGYRRIVTRRHGLHRVRHRVHSLSCHRTRINGNRNLNIISSITRRHCLLTFILGFLCRYLLITERRLTLMVLSTNFLDPMIDHFLLITARRVSLCSPFLRLLRYFLNVELRNLSHLRVRVLLLNRVSILIEGNRNTNLISSRNISLIRVLRHQHVLSGSLLLHHLTSTRRRDNEDNWTRNTEANSSRCDCN